jgi:hypothetical protein
MTLSFKFYLILLHSINYTRFASGSNEVDIMSTHGSYLISVNMSA